MTQEGRRTQALRGPGVGGFTPPQSVAASNPCLNCGTNVQLTFCPECGQRETEPDPTLKEFLHELAEELLHWDGKLATTFRTLVGKPGELTIEYLSGRRARYISPIRVYLSCSVVFFFLNAVAPVRIGVDKYGAVVEKGVITIGQSTSKDIASLNAEAAASSGIKRIWLTHFARAMESPRDLQHATTAAVPKAMFILVPLFAALIGLVYRDRRRKYPQHLAFALHIHAALFLTLSAMLLGRVIPSEAFGAVVQGLIAIPFAIYLLRATQRVYESRAGQAAGRLTMACALYGGAFIATLVALLALQVMLS